MVKFHEVRFFDFEGVYWVSILYMVVFNTIHVCTCDS